MCVRERRSEREGKSKQVRGIPRKVERESTSVRETASTLRERERNE